MNSYCPECDRQFERGAGLCPHDNTDLVPVEDEEDPLIGEVLEDRYRLDALLGSGGMGKVYRATQLTVDRSVAVKILRDELSDSEPAHERFSREARNISSLSHPNIVQLIDFGRDGDHGSWFLVMEQVEGQSLGLLLQKGRLHHELALEIVYQVCAGLADAHNRGMVHRDLKPENLHLTPVADGTLQVKVLDFGIARCVEQTTRMTRTDQICGTPAYVAPEQAAGSHEVDIRADFFALGVVLFEMLTGHLPFRADGPMQLMFKNAQQPFPRLADELSETAPIEQLQALLDLLTAKQPDNRPDSPAEIRGVIERIRRDLDRPVHRLADQFSSFEDLYEFVESADAGDMNSESPVPNRSSDAFARTAGAYQTVQPTVDPTDKQLDRADTPPNAGTERGVGEPVFAEDRDDVTSNPKQADGRSARAPDANRSTRRRTAETPEEREATNRRLTYGIVGLSITALALGVLVVLVDGGAASKETASDGAGTKPDDEPKTAEKTATSTGDDRRNDESSAASSESDDPNTAAAAEVGNETEDDESAGETPRGGLETGDPAEVDPEPPSSAGGSAETTPEEASSTSGTEEPTPSSDDEDDPPSANPGSDDEQIDSDRTGSPAQTNTSPDEKASGATGATGDESTGASSDSDESDSSSGDDSLEEMLESGTLRNE
jgi:serine/threonine-protein kinase